MLGQGKKKKCMWSLFNSHIMLYFSFHFVTAQNYEAQSRHQRQSFSFQENSRPEMYALQALLSLSNDNNIKHKFVMHA